MKSIIKGLLLTLALSLNLLAQENQISQSISSIEVTDDQVSTAEKKDAIILGDWGDRTLLKNTDRTNNFNSQEGWISLSPSMIGESLNDVHVFNETTAIIVGSIGAVYKTADRGINWNKIPSGTASGLNALFFLDDNYGWIVGGSGKVLKTVDGGDSWRLINTNFSILYDVFFTNVDTGYAISSKSIYMTTDSGENWFEKFKSTEPTYFFESIAFCNANTGIAVGCLSKMYRTTDAGETWTLIESGNSVWKYDVKFIDSSHGWMAGLQASRISISVGPLGTTIDIDNPQYALWETSDGGATWTQLNFAYSGRLYGVYFHDSTIGWTVGTNGAVFRTEDGGTTWNVTQSVHDMYAVHFCDAQSGWAVGDDGTIINSNNSGNLWTLQSGNGTTSDLYSVHFDDSLTGWAAGANGKLLRTTNGGGLWFEQDVNTSSTLESVFFINAQKGYTVWGSFPYVRYTTNGGGTWNYFSGPPPYLQGLNCVFFIDDQNGWFAGKNGNIMHTTNSGTSWGNWSLQTSGTTEELNSIHFVDPLTGWAVGNNGSIIRTQDGGTTWSPQQSGLSQNLQSVFFIDKTNGFIVGPTGLILQTTDGGANWERMWIGGSALNSVYFADAQTGWAVGNSGTILKTKDGGSTWGLQKSSTIKSLQAVQFLDTLTGYIIGKNSFVHEKLDLKQADLEKMVNDLLQPFQDVKEGKIKNLANVGFDLKLSQQLYQQIFQPIEKYLQKDNHLIIVPDGILHYLPFEALVTEIAKKEFDRNIIFSRYENAHYLVEKYAISYSPSASVLDPKLFGSDKKSKKEGQLIAFGNPDFGTAKEAVKLTKDKKEEDLSNYYVLVSRSSRGAMFDQLPKSEQEVRVIAEILKPSLLYVGSDAKEEYFKDKAGNFSNVHLATHCILEETQPMYSRIVFAQDDDPTEDGFLHTYEVFNLKLNADLVTLGACETGLGKLSRGEGLIGLTRAFMYAGAPSVVVSLWSVDESTAELMTLFYQNLKDGMMKAEALRQAKIKLLSSRGKFAAGKEFCFAHPYLWAPFVLMGEWK